MFQHLRAEHQVEARVRNRDSGEVAEIVEPGVLVDLPEVRGLVGHLREKTSEGRMAGTRIKHPEVLRVP